MIDEKVLLGRLKGMRGVVPAGGPMAVLNDVETIVGAMPKYPVESTRLTSNMLEQLSLMVNDEDWVFRERGVREALQEWLAYQWTLVPPRRYTVEVLIIEVDGEGEKIETVHVAGPSEATTDLAALESSLDQMSAELQHVFYSVGATGSYSHLDDWTRRADGSPIAKG